MSFTYAEKKRTSAQTHDTGTAQPDIESLSTGAAAPTQEQMGHRVDLPDAMREKMENAFGADLSAVKLYESEAVGEAGVEAVTQGSNIAFAPGMLDFTSYGGQALLGHEISHVVSQARGEVTGSGLLNDHALEARADREGAMAAAGQTVAMPSEAMSPVSAAAASGPMQCRGKRASNKVVDNLYRIGSGKYGGADITEKDQKYYDENIKTLSKRERTMIGKRARQSMREQYKKYQKMKAGSGLNRMGQVLMATSDHDADMSIYTNLLNDFATANNYSADERDAEFATQRQLLTSRDREQFEEMEDNIPEERSLADDDDYKQYDGFRKMLRKTAYQLSVSE